MDKIDPLAQIEKLISCNQYQKAIDILGVLADDDPSLDAGYYGYKIGNCFEAMGMLGMAKYWYGKAFSENPHIAKYANAYSKLHEIDVYTFLSEIDK